MNKQQKKTEFFSILFNLEYPVWDNSVGGSFSDVLIQSEFPKPSNPF